MSPNRLSSLNHPSAAGPEPRRTNLISRQLSLVRRAHHVLDGDASLGTRALDLGKVYPELVGLLLGGLRSVWLFLSTSRGILGLLRRASCGVLSLLGSPTSRVLSLLSGPSGCVLGLTRRLTRGVLCPLRRLSGLVGNLSYGALRLVGNLPYGAQASSFVPTCDLLSRAPDGLGYLLDSIS